MVRIWRTGLEAGLYCIDVNDGNHHCELLALTKENLIQLRESIGLLLKWEE